MNCARWSDEIVMLSSQETHPNTPDFFSKFSRVHMSDPLSGLGCGSPHHGHRTETASQQSWALRGALRVFAVFFILASIPPSYASPASLSSEI